MLLNILSMILWWIEMKIAFHHNEWKWKKWGHMYIAGNSPTFQIRSLSRKCFWYIFSVFFNEQHLWTKLYIFYNVKVLVSLLLHLMQHCGMKVFFFFKRSGIMPFSQDLTLMSPECVCEVSTQNTPHIFLYSMLKLSLFEGEQKTHLFVSVPLNANELLLLAQRAEPQQLVSFYLTQTHTENFAFYVQTAVRQWWRDSRRDRTFLNG